MKKLDLKNAFGQSGTLACAVCDGCLGVFKLARSAGAYDEE